jgi:hypothetical protein
MKSHQKINKRKQKRAAIGKEEKQTLDRCLLAAKIWRFWLAPSFVGNKIEMLLSDYMLVAFQS